MNECKGRSRSRMREKNGFSEIFLNAKERKAFSQIFVTRMNYRKPKIWDRLGAHIRKTLFP